jgi:hypothetical protein
MMKPPTEEPSTLSPHRAFVVQFRAETVMAQGRCTGRVEHVVSGQATHFQSFDELWAFMVRVLTVRRPKPRKQPQGDGS